MIESTILSHLVYNDAYCRKVLPFLQEQYFHNQQDKVVFGLINNY